MPFAEFHAVSLPDLTLVRHDSHCLSESIYEDATGMVISFALAARLKQSIGVWMSLDVLRTRVKFAGDDMVTLRR